MSNAKARNAAYEKIIGPDFVSFFDTTATPHIEVRRYRGHPAKNGPECEVWLTSGMSDAEMLDDDGDPLRRELIFYAEPGGDFTQALVAIARFPFENETFIDQGHSIQFYGSFFLPAGAEALLSADPLQLTLPHLVLLSPLLRHHQSLGNVLKIEDCPVEFLWIVPISKAELKLQKERGTDALLDVFEDNRHPWIFGAERNSYV